MTQWIKCSERLPEKSCDVIAMTKTHGVVCAYFDIVTKEYKKPEVVCYKKRKSALFTAWQPLPSPPEDEA